MGLSARAIARELKVSHTAVNKAVQSGRIHPEKDGSFDLAKVRKEWDRNADFHQQQRGAPKRSARIAESNDVRSPAPHAESGDGETESLTDPKFKDVQLRREKIKAEREQLRLDEEKKLLISAEEAKQVWSAMVTTARNKALMLPSELGPKLAVETDAVACEEVLRNAIYAFLSEMTEYQP